VSSSQIVTGSPKISEEVNVFNPTTEDWGLGVKLQKHIGLDTVVESVEVS